VRRKRQVTKCRDQRPEVLKLKGGQEQSHGIGRVERETSSSRPTRRHASDEADRRPPRPASCLHPPRWTGIISRAGLSLNRTNAPRLSKALVCFPSSVTSNVDATCSVTLSGTSQSLSVLRFTPSVAYQPRRPSPCPERHPRLLCVRSGISESYDMNESISQPLDWA
jgi:hypothetical protein